MKQALPSRFSKYGDFEAERGMAYMRLASVGSKTIIEHLRTKAPLLVQRALYPDSNLPGMAHIFLMSSAGGILQGDRLCIEIDAECDTVSHITTQAATKIYRMHKGFAVQTIDISAQGNSYVEFLPHQLIPFKSSRFYQDVNIRVAADSTVVYSETLCAGRTASGEKFDFDVCFLRMTTRDHKGKVHFADVCNIEPDGKRFELLFGSKTIWSTIYIITAHQQQSIDREINAAIKDRSMLAGCSSLPHDCGLFVRILDNSIDKVMDLTDMVIRITRNYTIKAR
jgi:urease accessory protein